MRKISYSPETIVKVPSLFGDGNDGNITITGTTTLSTDRVYRNLTVNAGGVLNTNGFRIFVQTLLTNRGVIRANGGDASGATGGANQPAGSVAASGLGGNGRSTIGTGAAGGSTTNNMGNDAGNGGAGGAQAGGAGGGSILPTASAGTPRNQISAILGHTIGSSGLTALSGGPGGGGGGNDSVTTISGGGGGGGGVLIISAQILDNGGGGIIRANGGNGANASGTGGNAGGGGGGSGGTVILHYLKFVAGQEEALAGSGGTGVGTGTVGGIGGDGFVFKLAAVI